MNFWLAYKMSENIEYPHHIFNSSKYQGGDVAKPTVQNIFGFYHETKREHFPDVKIHHWIML